MNKLLQILIASFALSLVACSTVRPIPIQDGKLAGILPMRDNSVYYEMVADVPGVSAETIYRQARRWVAFRTIDPKAPFESSDGLHRDIIGPGRLSSRRALPEKRGQFVFTTPTTDYTVSVECFDGKYRLAFTHFREILATNSIVLAMNGYGIESPTARALSNTRQYFRSIDERVLALSESLHRFIVKDSAMK